MSICTGQWIVAITRLMQRRVLRSLRLQKGLSWLSIQGRDSKEGEGWLEMEVRKSLDTESRKCQGSSREQQKSTFIPSAVGVSAEKCWLEIWVLASPFFFPQGQEAAWVQFYIRNALRRGRDYTGLNKCALS